MSKDYAEQLIYDVFEEQKHNGSLEMNITVTFGQFKAGESCLELGFDGYGCSILSATKAELTADGIVQGTFLSRRKNGTELEKLMHTETGINIRNFVKQEVLKLLVRM